MKHICTNFIGEPTRLSNCTDHPKWMVLRVTWLGSRWANQEAWAVFAPHKYYIPEKYTTTQQEAFDYARKRALQ